MTPNTELKIEEQVTYCSRCNGQGWYAGSEAGHGCDGLSENCSIMCPIQNQIQVGCEECEGKGVIKLDLK